MADDKKLEDFMKEVKEYLTSKGMVISDESALKAAFEKNSEMELSAAEAFAKPEAEEKAGNGNEPEEKDDAVKGIMVNEGGLEGGAEGPEAPENSGWQDEIWNEWKAWASENKLISDKYVDTTKEGYLCIKIYGSNDDKTRDEYAADLQYSSPNNLSLRAKDGKMPAQNVFDKSVAIAKAQNGPVVAFGNIQSNDFKARLMIACLKDPEVQMKDAPTAEEIKTWPKALQDQIAAARKGKEGGDNPKTEDRQLSAAEKIREIRDKIKVRNQDIAEAKEAALAAGGELADGEIEKIMNEGMKEDSLKLRELRGAAKAGDKNAAKELLEMREKTLTDDYKYDKETEMEADGKTPKQDKEGKPIYKKDKDGNFIYKQDDKGEKTLSPVYMAMKKKIADFSK